MEKWPAIVSLRDDSGWTPLHIAAHLGNAKFVQLLLTMGVSPAYELSKEGLSALHIAAKEGNYDVMDILLGECPDIYELLDKGGRNVLHTAAESGCWAALYVLGNRREFVGLVNEQDSEGNTPSHLAAINGDTSMAERLGKGGEIVLNAINKEGFTTMDNVLLTSKLHSQKVVCPFPLALLSAIRPHNLLEVLNEDFFSTSSCFGCLRTKVVALFNFARPSIQFCNFTYFYSN